VSAGGAWCWAEDGEDPDRRALATCEKQSGQSCRLYSVDEQVVWRGEPSGLERAGTIASQAGAGGAVGGTAAVTN
jgi:hypothetical protein